jgi:putative transposase
MTNHVHLIVTPGTADALPTMMQSVGRTYVPWFNVRYQRTGGLWEGRYRASLLHDERYWMTCLRYVELNPIRAGLAATLEAYPWSGYGAHAFGREDPLLTEHPLFTGLGTTAAARQEAWRAVCGTPMAEPLLSEIRRAVHVGRPLGEPALPEVA